MPLLLARISSFLWSHLMATPGLMLLSAFDTSPCESTTTLGMYIPLAHVVLTKKSGRRSFVLLLVITKTSAVLGFVIKLSSFPLFFWFRSLSSGDHMNLLVLRQLQREVLSIADLEHHSQFVVILIPSLVVKAFRKCMSESLFACLLITVGDLHCHPSQLCPSWSQFWLLWMTWDDQHLSRPNQFYWFLVFCSFSLS